MTVTKSSINIFRKSKVVEPEPEPEPVKVKLVLKGPHCWVDDATITSDQSECDQVDSPEQDGYGNADTPETNQQAAKATDDTKSLSKLKPSLKQNSNIQKQPVDKNTKQVKEAFEKVVQEAKTEQQGQTTPNEVMDPNNNDQVKTEAAEQNLGEPVNTKEEVEEEKHLPLPDFICPSSEKKSREAAVKLWLATSNFKIRYSDALLL